MRIGIIREGKVPPDQRVPLTPEHCAKVLERFPYVELVVQPSDVRRITDAEFAAAGVELSEDLSDCDVLFGAATFEPVVGFLTRYGYVELTNTASSLGNAADYVGLVGMNSGTNLKFK